MVRPVSNCVESNSVVVLAASCVDVLVRENYEVVLVSTTAEDETFGVFPESTWSSSSKSSVLIFSLLLG